MHAPGPLPTDRQADGFDVGGHILVGIDDTPESLVAAAQAGALRSPDGRLVLVAVAERYLAAHAGLAAAQAEGHVAAHTREDLAQATELVDADETVLRSGRLVPVLGVECERRGATLIAVGVRPHRLLPARVLRGHDVEALQQAACSVLIARPGWGPHKPDRVVVALDGSPPARRAEAVGRTLATRLGCDVVPVVALGEQFDETLLHAERDDALVYPGRVTDAVTGASTDASLIVVGRERGSGQRAADKLAERLVYSARCSVLVVRHDTDAPAQARGT